jgi:predicted RND superfamily exporter protein
VQVLTETWAQSRMLRYRGRRAADAQRVAWTIRQAAVPLFYANATTAASLLINCTSNIPSILQFGLCGGTLIFVNFFLVLT